MSSTETKSLKPLVVSIGVALVGMMMMSNHLAAERKRMVVTVDKVGVLSAERSLSAGEQIQASDLTHRLVTRDEQAWSSIRFEDPKSGLEAQRKFEDTKVLTAGRILTRDVKKGDILLWTDFEEDRREKLSALFQGNLRAVSVPVDTPSMMGGLLQPNDRVDVLATFPAGMIIRGGGSVEAQEKTMVILERVTVIAVGGRTAVDPAGVRGGGGTGSVVLALEPHQALLVSHVQKSAKISLLLLPEAGEQIESFGEDPARREVGISDVQRLIEEIRKTNSPRE